MRGKTQNRKGERMSEKQVETLQKQIQNDYGKLNLAKLQIPTHITDNLSKELREYQQDALRYYLAQRECVADRDSDIGKGTDRGNHLMFNMATGSGKTLIMAALMLDLYKRGYREFVFFVDSRAILEKTRSNFCDSKSEKYLFSQEIIIDSKRVEVCAVNNFERGRSEGINIVFNTIQGLHSLFTDERENSLTFSDLERKKLVLIADEAHHLNSLTKKKLDKKEEERKKSWESTIKKALKSGEENLLLEFSTTIPQDEGVMQKYRDKIVYEYALKQFYEDRYSKKIFLIKYGESDAIELFLGACAMSVYRQLAASKADIVLKPVVLFKSGNIKESERNEGRFYEFLARVDAARIERFFSNVDCGDSSDDKDSTKSRAEYGTRWQEELLARAKGFFKEHFKEQWEQRLAEHIKLEFHKSYCINMNDEKKLEENQILINTLESSSNEVHAIFAVDKLNEGWDVLNLFDIVRLDNVGAKSAKIGDKVATRDAQLIGRGARYYPFRLSDEEDRYRRKFDNGRHKLDVLEALSYHSSNEVGYINALHKALEAQGTPALSEDERRKKYVLKPQKKALEIARALHERGDLAKGEASGVSKILKDANTQAKSLSIPVVSNHLTKLTPTAMGDLFSDYVEGKLGEKIASIHIPLLNDSSKTQDEAYNERDSTKSSKASTIKTHAESALESSQMGEYKSLECIAMGVFLKAMNKLSIGFSTLKNMRQIKSKREFIERFLYPLQVRFHARQSFDKEAQLSIALYILEKLKEILNTRREMYRIEPFRVREFALREREIWSAKPAKTHKYEWLVYDSVFQDSGLEGEFLDFIDGQKSAINGVYDRWLVIRNECFDVLKLYACKACEGKVGLDFANNNGGIESSVQDSSGSSRLDSNGNFAFLDSQFLESNTLISHSSKDFVSLESSRESSKQKPLGQKARLDSTQASIDSNFLESHLDSKQNPHKNNQTKNNQARITDSPIGFYPDFVFWGMRKDKREVIFQCFIEAKGAHLEELDRWKEEFLQALNYERKAQGVKHIELRGMGFFTEKSRQKFTDEFRKIVLGSS